MYFPEDTNFQYFFSILIPDTFYRSFPSLWRQAGSIGAISARPAYLQLPLPGNRSAPHCSSVT